MEIRNKLGKKYELELISREKAIDILSNLDHLQIARKIETMTANLGDGFMVEVDLDLSSGEVTYSYNTPGTSSIANHYIPITDADNRYRFRDYMWDVAEASGFFPDMEEYDLPELIHKSGVSLGEYREGYFAELAAGIEADAGTGWDDWMIMLEEIYG